MLKPDYSIQIGAEIIEPKVESPLVFLRINIDVDIPADCFEIMFGISSKTSKIKKEDDVSIKLGYKGDLKDVFKGTVDNVEPNISGIRVQGYNFATKLLKLRTNQVYENQTAGGIVTNLADKAGLSTEEVSDGIRFPLYFVDDNKNAFEHMSALAERCGFNVYLTSENKVIFKKFESQEPHVFEYGKNIIEINLQEEFSPITGVMVQGESPSSFKGADTSHWLTKRQVEGIAGSGTSLLIQDPAIRDKDTAETVAKAKLGMLERTVLGTVKIIGKADVRLGDTLEIKGMSNSKMNGEFQVIGVEHFLSKSSGYTTLINWRK